MKVVWLKPRVERYDAPTPFKQESRSTEGDRGYRRSFRTRLAICSFNFS